MARARILVSRSALLQNYRILSEKVPHLKLLPMVKANAYGHGAAFTAESFIQEKNLYAFGVASFAEGVALRQQLKNKKVSIVVFSDCAPWSRDLMALCLTHHLEPVFSEIVSLLEFQADPRARDVEAHVEINTGMNRLGIPSDSLRLLRFLPKSIFTHLADADAPNSRLTRMQIKNFTELMPYLKQRFPRAHLHFANSATLWNPKAYPLLKEMDIARPGLSLYGIRPYEKAKTEGLKRAMHFYAPVINRIFLNPGDRVGYGGTYTCRKKSGEWLAIIAAGYGDGVFRSLSGQGIALHGKKKLSLIGRVSMDLSAVQGHAKMKIGDEVELWGDGIDPYEQANLAGTIPYELTTRMGERVERVYER